MSLIPAPWPVLHTPVRLAGEPDNHGNQHFIAGVPVVRYVISLSQSAKTLQRASVEVFSTEYLQQVVTSLHMTVPVKDLLTYESGDKVLIGGDDVAGDYVGGVSFLCHGAVSSDVWGPWPKLYKNFGGMVLLHRAT